LDTLFVTRAKQCDTALSGLSKVVEGIGSQIFWPNLISYLDEEIGGEHCVVWNLSNERMNPVGSASWNGSDQSHRRLVQYTNPNFWRRDPGLSIARKEASDGASVIVRMDPRNIADRLIRETLYGEDHIGERIMVCRPRPDTTFGLSIVRGEDRGPFSKTQLDTFAIAAETLLSIIRKHAQICGDRPKDNPLSVARLPEIEDALQNGTPPMPRREAQVCARMLCGHSLPNIAHELGVSPETIETYRKRSYIRLKIGNKQELLLKYLGYC